MPILSSARVKKGSLRPVATRRRADDAPKRNFAFEVQPEPGLSDIFEEDDYGLDRPLYEALPQDIVEITEVHPNEGLGLLEHPRELKVKWFHTPVAATVATGLSYVGRKHDIDVLHPLKPLWDTSALASSYLGTSDLKCFAVLFDDGERKEFTLDLPPGASQPSFHDLVRLVQEARQRNVSSK